MEVIPACQRARLRDDRIIPDLMRSSPRQVLTVYYPSLSYLRMGNVLTPTQVKEEPALMWHSLRKCYYTVCMVDPDTPLHKSSRNREWLHWLVGNIPGCVVQQGEILAPYIGASPPKLGGMHRYVLMVYKQKKKINFEEERLIFDRIEGRCTFTSAKFAKKHDLGQPIAINYFKAQWDEYIPKFNKSVGVPSENGASCSKEKQRVRKVTIQG